VSYRHLSSLIVLTVAVAALSGRSAVAAQAQQGNGQRPAAIDPQAVQDQDTMTWADYKPIPGRDWATSPDVPQRAFRVALIAVDFDDQPFVITMPKGSDPFGNPQINPIPREKVPQFYADFYGKPNADNHGHTIHGYWMEQTRGKFGIPKIDIFGPYRMPKKLYQYGLNEWGQGGGCPTGATCDGEMEPDVDAMWQAEAGKDIRSKYDLVLRLYAGYDETSVWQEFGEMRFIKDKIPAEWGNPDSTKPRWVATRYVPWTTWKAGQMQWGLSSMRQGESSGTITHEIAHHAFDIGDNNNNPYVKPYRRVGSGPWDIMDRGSFNGPGGPHNRWVVPAAGGAAMPAGFTLRSRLKFGFVAKNQVLSLNRNGLAVSGLAVATVVARAVDPGANGLAGIVVNLDGAAPQDRTPACDKNADPLCAGDPVFNFYTVETVQRIGYDSFTPDNGVLVSKNTTDEVRSCGYGCFTWVIDAHPEDINVVDFVRPDGTKVMRTVADYRQLNDALFHAGTNSGSQFEWEDTANRLHFYVVDLQRDASGILSYTVGVRSLDGSGPHTRGVVVTAPTTRAVGTTAVEFRVGVKNTGVAGTVAPTLHPQDVTKAIGHDIYRVKATVAGNGWLVTLPNELVALPFGASGTVPVHVNRSSSAAPTATVSVTVVSESDPKVSKIVSWKVAAGRD
jgi:M6 family metalloprotease-like protein